MASPLLCTAPTAEDHGNGAMATMKVTMAAHGRWAYPGTALIRPSHSSWTAQLSLFHRMGNTGIEVHSQGWAGSGGSWT
jgi:tetrahydromethanopterin S-methyltransferase subunit H